MTNIVLFGPPGSGKGTQAEKLVEKYQLIHCSTGDLFRFNIKNETELGLLAKSYMDKGQLVPDKVTNDMLKDFVRKNKSAKGFIFDGYPRTIAQAETLDIFLSEELQSSVNQTLALTVEDNEVIERLLERGKSSGRSDDANVEVIKDRLTEYYNKTNPVAEYYKNQNKYTEVIGVGSIKDITRALSVELEKIL